LPGANDGLVADASTSGASARWNDLGRRALSAAVLAPLALGCIWYGGPPYILLIAFAAVGLAIEWVWLCGATPSRVPGAAVPAVVLAGLVLALHWFWTGAVLMLAGFAVLWIATRRAQLGAGILYVGLPTMALEWLRLETASGRANVLLLVLIVWASDIGAYAVGRLLDGPKLAPRLSPGKTWSGAIGGLIAAIVVGQLAAGLLGGAPIGRTAVLAGLLGIATQAGDLLESGIKRHFGVKDSGRLIPGHGGLLDRLDGLLAAAPVAAVAVLIGRGGALWQ
jgi:phosphatidate cytidylyltransferase